jgi:uncharacterized protein with GYD domain
MIFISLLKVLPGKVAEQPHFIKRIMTVQPPQGIKIVGSYLLFGRFDGAIIFEAPDPKRAMDFIIKVASPGVYETETLIAMPAEDL